jgi:hypothetical protein
VLRLAFVPLLLALQLPSFAQGPAAPWRTLETPHFRLHYLAPAEEWTRRAAGRLEAVRARVSAEVGYEPPEVVDVLVSDPAADANGAAFPILGWPRLTLWTSPPEPESELGAYRDYTELLVVHEETHLVHLLRPSRNPARHLLESVVPVGPIALAAPRWVTEGYATLVEGRLTAAGRPNSDLRAAILRRWAEAGRLPSYPRLASDSESWQGMSMAYLLGSAYLEWLEQRAGPGSLKKLWARMTARSPRSFDAAFGGVFDASPDGLYDRFCAELTWRALEAERRVAAAGPAAAREGELWQDLSWSTGAPSISPDGKQIAVVVHARQRPAELVIWSTGKDEEAEKKARQERQRLAARDPEDVPAVETRPPPRRALYTLEASGGIAPRMQRWLPDGKTLLFVRFEPDGRGVLHPDLFTWTPERLAVRRITRGADLREPDPAPDGRWAVAVRDRNGYSQLVRVDLGSGEVHDLTPPSLEQVYARPRVAPGGRRVAFVRSGEGTWKLVVLELDAAHPEAAAAGRELAPPHDATVASPAWSPDGRTLYAVVGAGGFIDLWAFAVDPAGSPLAQSVQSSPPSPPSPAWPLTRVQGAALAPEPTPDGSAIFFLSLKPAGLELRRLEVGTLAANGALTARWPALAPPEAPPGLVPAVRPPAPPIPPPFAVAGISASRPYGVGRQELLPILGGGASSAGGAVELGVRSGDVVGRLDVLAVGALSSSGWAQGGALAAAWRGWPVELTFHLFDARERPGQQSGRVPAAAAELTADRRGGELGASWERVGEDGQLRLGARLLDERVEGAAPSGRQQLAAGFARRSLRLGGRYAAHRRWGEWRGTAEAHAGIEAGRSGDEDWQRFGGGLELSVKQGGSAAHLSWERDGSRHANRAFDLFSLGGAAGSLLPESVLAGRIFVPALPQATLIGAQHEGERAELEIAGVPLPLFYERHRLWTGGGRATSLTLAGLEYRLSFDPYPIVRAPRFDLRLGAARILSGPFARETRWWLTTAWRP